MKRKGDKLCTSNKEKKKRGEIWQLQGGSQPTHHAEKPSAIPLQVSSGKLEIKKERGGRKSLSPSPAHPRLSIFYILREENPPLLKTSWENNNKRHRRNIRVSEVKKQQLRLINRSDTEGSFNHTLVNGGGRRNAMLIQGTREP